MRVALDINPLYITQAGVARYLDGLTLGFGELAAPDLEIITFGWPVTNFGYRQPWRAMRTAYREMLWPYVAARSQLRRLRPDVVHINSGMHIPTPPSAGRIATVHDCAVLRFPERFRRWHASGARRRVERLRTMDRIICISQFTADEVMEFSGVDAAKIEIVLHGGNSFDRTSPSASPSFPVPDEFFLFVGSLEPGKNLQLLRAVYARAAEQGTRLPPLIIVGARWEGVPTEGPPPEGWTYAGRIPDEQLLFLYRNALALVFPSIYEGFGLPPLEAMSQGCPVICSPVASLPEVVGDTACMADHTAESYLDAMRRLCQSEELRSDLGERGIHRAARFSWRRCAEETREVYKKVLRH